MSMPDGIWIALFFAASGVLGTFLGRNEKKVRENRMEYFNNIPGVAESPVKSGQAGCRCREEETPL